MPKVIPSENFPRRDLSYFSDERWARITNPIPVRLSAENDARLRRAVTSCCSRFLSQQARLQVGMATAAAMRRRGKGQRAPLERLADGLRMAANAWAKIGRIRDDRLGDIDIYKNLEAMACDAERRLAGIRKLGKPVTIEAPWPVFVGEVARCCRAVGLDPTVTGRAYEGGKPTWFQDFIAALDKNLLGGKNLLGIDRNDDQFERDHRAFYAAVAKALRGDKKAGKARK